MLPKVPHLLAVGAAVSPLYELLSLKRPHPRAFIPAFWGSQHPSLWSTWGCNGQSLTPIPNNNEELSELQILVCGQLRPLCPILLPSLSFSWFFFHSSKGIILRVLTNTLFVCESVSQTLLSRDSNLQHMLNKLSPADIHNNFSNVEDIKEKKGGKNVILMQIWFSTYIKYNNISFLK